MTQTVPATAVLGPGKTGLAIGLRVLNLDGTTYAAFATTGVAETSVLGTYRKAGGVVCPAAGGYIVWGVSGTDYAEATVESTAANVTLWQGDVPQFLDGGAVVASVSSVGGVSGVVNANVVQYNSQWMYYGVVSGVSGNVITTTGLKTNPDGTALADDKLIAFVGWQVMFYHQIAGYPPTDVFWRATIVSYTESTITVDAMPADNLASDVFFVYILPPAFGASSAIDGQDVADALLLAPAGAAAAGSAMAELAAILEDTGTTLPGLIAGVGAGSGTGYYSDILESPLGTPVDGARVTLTTDDDGENVAYEARTDAFGVFEMRPDPGTYYRFIEAAGHTFVQGVEVEVTEP